MKIKIKHKLEGNHFFFDWRVKLKRKITLIKEKNQKNMHQIRKKKQHTINFDWMMKLKTNKTLTKVPKKKKSKSKE